MKRPHEIISDEEVARVHANANFGTMTPREVLADGVAKYSMGYTGGSTQLAILREHGLITKPKPGSYRANLTEKGKAYLRSVAGMPPEAPRLTHADLKAKYMGQIMAECDCEQEASCQAAGRCLAEGEPAQPDFIEEMQR